MNLHRVKPTSEVVTDAVRRAVTVEAGKMASARGITRRELPLLAWEKLAKLAKEVAKQEAKCNGFPMNKTKEIGEWAVTGFVAARTAIILNK